MKERSSVPVRRWSGEGAPRPERDRSREKPTLRVVDLFCGCGGLTRGLERTGRFSTILGVDNNKAAIDTFARNHGDDLPPETHLGEMRHFAQGPMWELLQRRDVRRPGDLDCLVGGPPCEGFSRNTVYTRRRAADDAGVTSAAAVQYRESKYWQSAWSSPATPAETTPAGRVVRAYNPFLTDPRNLLFRAFLDVADLLRPRIVLIENVRQILTHGGGSIAEEIVGRLDALGYATEARTLNAADYGVPQLRQRAFFLAVRRDALPARSALPWPEPTHAPGPSDGYRQASLPIALEGQRWPGDGGAFVSVAEAIADLPPARSEREGNPRLPVDAYSDHSLSAFRRFVRSTEATPANHVHRTPGEPVIRRLRAMRPGMRLHDLPADLRTRKYYYNSYGRLDWDTPANTITKSFLYPGSGRFGHPEADRVITYREAARLQSFDDDFTFHASSQEGVASMIGSAVPPLIGFRLGTAIAELLDACEGAQLTIAC